MLRPTPRRGDTPLVDPFAASDVMELDLALHRGAAGCAREWERLYALEASAAEMTCSGALPATRARGERVAARVARERPVHRRRCLALLSGPATTPDADLLGAYLALDTAGLLQHHTELPGGALPPGEVTPEEAAQGLPLAERLALRCLEGEGARAEVRARCAGVAAYSLARRDEHDASARYAAGAAGAPPAVELYAGAIRVRAAVRRGAAIEAVELALQLRPVPSTGINYEASMRHAASSALLARRCDLVHRLREPCPRCVSDHDIAMFCPDDGRLSVPARHLPDDPEGRVAVLAERCVARTLAPGEGVALLVEGTTVAPAVRVVSGGSRAQALATCIVEEYGLGRGPEEAFRLTVVAELPPALDPGPTHR